MMVSIFQFNHYKEFVLAWIEQSPRKGRGQFLKISRHLNVHPSLISKIFHGDKNLTIEQAYLLTEYLAMGELDTEYFMALVQRETAGNIKLKTHLNGKLRKLKDASKKLSKRYKDVLELGENEKALYYSNWYYSAVRLATSIKGLHDIHSISERLKLPPWKVKEVLDFLESNGLCVQKKDGYHMGPARVHIDSDNPWISNHHRNWRSKVEQRFDHIKSSELVFTSLHSLSEKDAGELREMIVEFLKKVGSRVERSPAETLYCLNIDWFNI